MSLDNSYRAYGRYLVTFNRLNPLLDAAIAREAGLGPVPGAIVTGAQNTKTRLGMLRGLLLNAGGEKASIAPLLAEITQDAKKQPMLQGLAYPGGTNSLLFARPETSGRMSAASAEYTAEEMDGLADALEANIEKLALALAITPADLAEFKRAGDEGAARRKRGNGGAIEEDAE